MDYTKFRNIFIEALNFRNAIEECDKTLLPTSFQTFPKDSCGDASVILAHYLKEKGYGEFEYVTGIRMEKSHGWLKQDDFIIDITADQFADNNEKVIVTVNPKWHSEFTEEKKHIADLSIYDESSKVSLLNAYNEILKNINHNE